MAITSHLQTVPEWQKALRDALKDVIPKKLAAKGLAPHVIADVSIEVDRPSAFGLLAGSHIEIRVTYGGMDLLTNSEVYDILKHIRRCLSASDRAAMDEVIDSSLTSHSIPKKTKLKKLLEQDIDEADPFEGSYADNKTSELVPAVITPVAAPVVLPDEPVEVIINTKRKKRVQG